MAGDMLQIQCACAIHDRQYIMRFIQLDSGKYRWLESVKTGPMSAKDKAVVALFQEVGLDQLERNFSCAWCSDRSINYCSQCVSFVCGGRKKVHHFICRDSCGAEWDGVPLDRVMGLVQQECLEAPRQVTNMKPQGGGIVRAASRELVPVRHTPAVQWRQLPATVPWWKR